MTRTGRNLSIVVCAAGPARDASRLVTLAQDARWDVQVIATPSALEFIDIPGLERQTGHRVRSQYRRPCEPRSPQADAIIVAPATFNTINKFAQGIADTYALGVLSEAPGMGVPVIVLPFVNSALASRTPFRRSVEDLRADGVHVLLGPGQFEPHPPGSGGDLLADYPWELALAALERSPSG